MDSSTIKKQNLSNFKQQNSKNNTIKGTLFALIAGTLWGLSGICAQFLFQNKNLTPEWPTGEVILKLVNAGSRSEKVQIEFSGLKKRQLVSGSCTYLQSDDWKAKNTLEQEAIVPRIRPAVRLAPITLISSPVSCDRAAFNTSSTVIPFGCTCHPQ